MRPERARRKLSMAVMPMPFQGAFLTHALRTQGVALG